MFEILLLMNVHLMKKATLKIYCLQFLSIRTQSLALPSLSSLGLVFGLLVGLGLMVFWSLAWHSPLVLELWYTMMGIKLKKTGF